MANRQWIRNGEYANSTPTLPISFETAFAVFISTENYDGDNNFVEVGGSPVPGSTSTVHVALSRAKHAYVLAICN